jgi:hypothetical protein
MACSGTAFTLPKNSRSRGGLGSHSRKCRSVLHYRNAHHHGRGASMPHTHILNAWVTQHRNNNYEAGATVLIVSQCWRVAMPTAGSARQQPVLPTQRWRFDKALQFCLCVRRTRKRKVSSWVLFIPNVCPAILQPGNDFKLGYEKP